MGGSALCRGLLLTPLGGCKDLKELVQTESEDDIVVGLSRGTYGNHWLVRI